MRSSKSRSRSKSNRQRSLGNIINRVFDSSGPEGKVRGTPQQIIDKYLMLARDAQLSNDRVAEQNFLQHAEHYTRLLGEAQRELQKEQEQRQQQNQQHHQGGGQNGGQNGERGQNGGRDRFDQRGERNGDQGDGQGLASDVDEGSGLVETPEARAAARHERAAPAAEADGTDMTDRQAEGAPAEASAPRRERKPRGAPKGEPRSAGEAEGEGAPRAPRRPRAKRESKAQEGGADTPEDSASAAE